MEDYIPVGPYVTPRITNRERERLDRIERQKAELAPEAELPQWLTIPDPPETTQATRSLSGMALTLTQYDNIFERTIEQVCRGRSLHSLIEEDHREISYEHFMKWVKDDSMRYERFKEAQAMRTEFIAGEIIEIADAEDSVEDVQRSKLRIDTRKYLMGAWNKKRYGEVKQIEMGGQISILSALSAAQARVMDMEIVEVIDVVPRID